MELRSDMRFQTPTHVIDTTFDESTILLDIETAVFYNLNTVASRILSCLNNGLTVEETFAQLMQEFDVEASQLKTDIEMLLDHLLTLQLIQVVH